MSAEDYLPRMQEINARYAGVLARTDPSQRNQDTFAEYVSLDDFNFISGVNLFPDFEEKLGELEKTKDSEQVASYVREYCGCLRPVEVELLRELTTLSHNKNEFFNENEQREFLNFVLSTFP